MTKHSLWFRLLSGCLTLTLLNLMAGGPALAATLSAQQRALEQLQAQNQRALAGLGLQAPSASVLQQRLQDKRAQAKAMREKLRGADLRRQASAQLERSMAADEIRSQHMTERMTSLSQLTRDVENLVADLLENPDVAVEERARQLLLYRGALKEALDAFGRDRQFALGADAEGPFPPAIESAILDRIEQVMAPLEALPDDPAMLDMRSVRGVVTATAEVLKRLHAPPQGLAQAPKTPGMQDGMPDGMYRGFDPVRGTPLRAPPMPPGQLQHQMLEPRSDDAIQALFGDALLNPPPAPGILDARASQRTIAPATTADLAETTDTVITPEIQALADALHNDPLEIYLYVRNHLDYRPYYGSREGAAGALSRGEGNDADLSSLLIALLRASDIPARYEYGKVEIPVAQVPGMVGVTDYNTAATLLTSMGIPFSTFYQGNTPLYAKIERTWVRAYVPYTNYRGKAGLASSAGESQWVALDPAFKQYSLENRIDVRGRVTFDVNGYISAPTSTAPIEFYGKQLQTALKATGETCPTLEDGRFQAEIVPENLEILPSSLPYKLNNTPVAASELPTSLRAKASINVMDPYGTTLLTYSFSLPELFGKRLTLSFPSGSTLDSSLSGSVTPTLALDDVKKASGSRVQAGYDLPTTITLQFPGGDVYVFDTEPVAGGTYNLNIEMGHIHPDRIANVQAEIRQLKSSGATQSSIDRRIGKLAALQWVDSLHQDDELLFDINGYRYEPQYVFLTGASAAPRYYFGIVIGAMADGYLIDAEERMFGVPRQGAIDNSKLISLMYTAGYTGSFWEQAVWGMAVSKGGLSTTNVLQLSRATGMTVYFLNNYSEYQAVASKIQHPAEVINDVVEMLQSGGRVVIGEKPLSYSGRTTSGYVLQSPNGSGQYLIHGQLGGGQSIDVTILTYTVMVGNCLTTIYSKASPGDGYLLLSNTDMKLDSVGPSLNLKRNYNSQSSTLAVPSLLGPGWSLSFGARLITESNGNMTFVDPGGWRWTFTKQSNGTYAAPLSYNGTLSKVSSSYLLEDPDHQTFTFDAAGRLSSVSDVSGNTLGLEYASTGALQTVLDALGREAYTFTADSNNLITSVTDLSGRSVSYTYSGGRLSTYTDARGKTWSYTYFSNGSLGQVNGPDQYQVRYGYDSKGRITSYFNESDQGGYLSYDDVNRRTVHTKADGSGILYQFDAQGRCISTTDVLGNTTTRTYQNGRMTSAVDPQGRTASWQYDTEGNVTQSVDTAGNTSSFTFEPGTGRVLTVDRGDNSFNYTYQNTASGSTVAVTNSAGKTTTTSLNTSGQVVQISRPDGSAVSVGYDTVTGTTSQVIQVDPQGISRTTTIGRGDTGAMESVTSADGVVRSLSRDDNGNVISMADNSGHAFSLTYDGQNRVNAMLDAEGRGVNMTWNHQQLDSMTPPSGQTVTYQYDRAGRKIAETNWLGNSRTYQYDGLGRLTRMTDEFGRVTELGWCAELSGHPCDVIDPLGNLTTYELDEAGRVLSATLNPGTATAATTTYERDAVGRVKAVVDALNQRTEYQWTTTGKLKQVKDPEGYTTVYGYDAVGHLTSITDARNKLTQYKYNGLGQLNKIITPDNKETVYTYDGNGQPKTITQPDGSSVTRTYDALGRITKEAFKNSSGVASLTRSLQYDTRGRLLTASTGTHQVTFTYDDATDRLLTSTDGKNGGKLTYSWDPTTLSRASLQGPGGTASYYYNRYGQPASVVTPSGGIIKYGYDALGRVSSVTFPNKVVEVRGYDGLGRLESRLYYGANGAIMAGEKYAFDAVGQLIATFDEQGRKTTYTYTRNGQLASAKGPGQDKAYVYDGNGNRLETWENGVKIETCTYGDLNQRTSCTVSAGTDAYTYDPRGQLTQVVTAGGSVLYGYDDAGQLVTVTAAGSSLTTSVTYEYDALGRRIREVKDGVTRQYLHDFFNPAVELDESGTALRRYVSTARTDETLVMRQLGATTTDYYIHADGRQSVIALSNASGQLQTLHRYGAFGEALSTQGTPESPLRFAGRPTDQALGLVDQRARAYQPSTGSFLQRDPIRPETLGLQRTGMAALLSSSGTRPLESLLQNPIAGLSPYAYAGNNPMTYWDPSGEGRVIYSLFMALAYTLAVMNSGTTYYPTIYEAWKLGDNLKGELDGADNYKEPWGILLGKIWSYTLEQILTPMEEALDATPDTYTLPCGFIKELTEEHISGDVIDDPEILGLAAWIIVAWTTYFVYLNEIFIFLFQMPSNKEGIVFECECDDDE